MTLAGVCGSAEEMVSIPDQTWLFRVRLKPSSPLHARSQLARSPSISAHDALCCRTFDSERPPSSNGLPENHNESESHATSGEMFHNKGPR